MSVVWHLSELASLHWKCWGDEWVVFDVGSGQTHQMDALTAATLLTVEACAGKIDQLVSQIANELMVPNDHELSNAVRSVLERLATTGLIESTLQ